MRAYKFRASSQIAFALDIMLNRRLFCADWRHLNDPMEGVYAYATQQSESSSSQLRKRIAQEKTRHRVCSLSADFQSHLLWAHYAGGFDGLAIEVDLPDSDTRVRRVEYRGVFAFLNLDSIADEHDAVRSILFSKYMEWSHEQEIRVLTDCEFYELRHPVRRIIVGPRMHPALKKALHMVCERERIGFFRVGIGDEGIDADTVRPADLEDLRHQPRIV